MNTSVVVLLAYVIVLIAVFFIELPVNYGASIAESSSFTYLLISSIIGIPLGASLLAGIELYKKKRKSQATVALVGGCLLALIMGNAFFA